MRAVEVGSASVGTGVAFEAAHVLGIALQVAPSSYYAAKTRSASARATSDAVLMPALVAIEKNNYRVYGARKLCKAARRAGHDVGRDQVARLMRAAEIQGVRRSKRVVQAPQSQPHRSNRLHASHTLH